MRLKLSRRDLGQDFKQASISAQIQPLPHLPEHREPIHDQLGLFFGLDDRIRKVFPRSMFMRTFFLQESEKCSSFMETINKYGTPIETDRIGCSRQLVQVHNNSASEFGGLFEFKHRELDT